MKFERGFVMNTNDVIKWFHVDEKLISLSFEDWFKIDVSIDTRLHLLMLCRLKDASKTYKKLRSQYKRGLCIITPDDIYKEFNKLIEDGYTFKVYDRLSAHVSPWHHKVFGVDIFKENVHCVQSSVGFKWWEE